MGTKFLVCPVPALDQKQVTCVSWTELDWHVQTFQRTHLLVPWWRRHQDLLKHPRTIECHLYDDGRRHGFVWVQYKPSGSIKAEPLPTVQQTSAPRVQCHLPAEFHQFHKHLHHVSSVTCLQSSNGSTNICATCLVSPACRVPTVQQTSAPRV